MAVKIEVMVFWVDAPYSMVGGHQHFGGPCCIQHNTTQQSRQL